MRWHPVRDVTHWRGWQDVPLESRLGPAPAAVLEFLALDNALNGFEAVPSPPPDDPAFLADVRAALAELPPALTRALGPKLIGVFTVRGLGSSAYAEYVRGPGGEPAQSFVVIDVDALGRAANAWLTWKESSPFLPAEGVAIRATLAEEGADTRQRALSFILLHELAHVLSVGGDAHPPWSEEPSRADVARYPFLAHGWRLEGRRWRIKADPPPGPIVYYKPSVDRPEADEAEDYYDWLATTDFPTLYAATSPHDDFAESVATYAHVVLQGRPFEITLERDGVVTRRHVPCWSEARCAAKRRLIEAFLGGP